MEWTEKHFRIDLTQKGDSKVQRKDLQRFTCETSCTVWFGDRTASVTLRVEDAEILLINGKQGEDYEIIRGPAQVEPLGDKET